MDIPSLLKNFDDTVGKDFDEVRKRCNGEILKIEEEMEKNRNNRLIKISDWLTAAVITEVDCPGKLKSISESNINENPIQNKRNVRKVRFEAECFHRRSQRYCLA